MKKTLALILALSMVLVLAACGASGGAPAGEPAAPAAPAAPTAPAAAPAEPAAPAAPAAADWKPAKEITLICPWAAGGAGDVGLRLIAEIIQEQKGYTVVVEDITGGSSAVGLSQVMATTDGYTVGLASSSWLSLLALNTVPYTWDDCQVVSCLYDEAFFILVPANSPYQTTDDLMNAVKANPGTITCGGSGSANVNQTLPVLLANSVDSSFNYVPFDGGSRVLSEILGGNVDCVILKPVECSQYLETGELKAIGVFGDERLDNYPDVGTFVEQGYDIYKDGKVAMVDFWLAPVTADQDTIDHVREALMDAMNSEKFQEYCTTNSVTLNPVAGDEGRAHITAMFDGINSLFNQLYN